MPLVHRCVGRIGRKDVWRPRGGRRAKQAGTHKAPRGPPNWFLATLVIVGGGSWLGGLIITIYFESGPLGRPCRTTCTLFMIY